MSARSRITVAALVGLGLGYAVAVACAGPEVRVHFPLLKALAALVGATSAAVATEAWRRRRRGVAVLAILVGAAALVAIGVVMLIRRSTGD